MIFLGFAFGAPFSGWFSDHIGRRKIVMIPGTMLAILCLVPVIYYPQMGPSLAYLFLLLPS